MFVTKEYSVHQLLFCNFSTFGLNVLSSLKFHHQMNNFSNCVVKRKKIHSRKIKDVLNRKTNARNRLANVECAVIMMLLKLPHALTVAEKTNSLEVRYGRIKKTK